MVRDWRIAVANNLKRSNSVAREEKEVVHHWQPPTLGSFKVNVWQPPTLGSFKVNVDAAVCIETESFSLGMVMRDHTGMFIEGKVMKLRCPESVFAAEAIGVREALSWIAEKDIKDVRIETDSLLTVQALQRGNGNQLEVGHVLQSCLCLLDANPSFLVTFIRRQANRVAHEMAKLPCLINCYNLFTSPPDVLLETILYDSSF